MAYNESAVGGSLGGAYRVWVNSIRTHDGGPADNSEDWRVEGGLNKIAGGNSAWNNYNNSSFTLQLGLNGVASSGNFSYNFASSTTGRVLAWGTPATKVFRNPAGVGYGFQSRMDINLANGPYLTSGWVTSNDSVQTKYRHASISAISIEQGISPSDEGPIWVEFNNPSGAAVDAWIETFNGSSWVRAYTSSSGIGSRFNFPFTGALQTALQQAYPNSTIGQMRIGIHDSLGGDSWDFRQAIYAIKNDTGQANPTYSSFTFRDSNSTTSAVTGSDQVLIQNQSTLEVKVPIANKATANKHATMSTYNVTIGGYSQNSAWSNTVDVVHNVGAVSDVVGTQNLSVRAVDSRGNSKAVTNPVLVLPYQDPAIIPTLKFGYVNNYDKTDGIQSIEPGSVIANVSPLTLSGTDKNTINPTTGIAFDMSKENNTSYTGTWVNVATTQAPGTGVITTDFAVLNSAILTKMNALTSDNNVRWYLKFRIVDSIQTKYYETHIDIGRPIFRIGADGNLYHNETALLDVKAVTSNSSISPDGDAYLNTFNVSALATNLSISDPAGVKTDFNRILFRFKDNGTARTITWGSKYRSGGTVLPTATVANKTMYVGVVYNEAADKWDCVLVTGGL